MSGESEGWDSCVSRWAKSRPDISALVQIGSRAQGGASVDEWSDYDYHLVTSRPEAYRDGSFARELGKCWVSGAQVAFGNAVKITAVYEGALEADFVVLSSLDVRIVMAALKWPSTARFWPRALRLGVESFQIVAAPGWRVIKGGAAWERRYSRVSPLRSVLSEREYTQLCGEFWTQLVWAAKKAVRGEYRASQRALHLHLLENTMRMLQEQALLEGRKAYPLSRRAEGWLTERELRGTDIDSAPSGAPLLAALEKISGTFAESSAAVATLRGWKTSQQGEVTAWLGEKRLSLTGKARQ